MENWLKVTIGVVVLLFVSLMYYVLFLNHVSVNEFAVYYDSYNGNVWTKDEPGWYTTSPLTRATTISTLPFRVTIPSEAKVIVTKYVRFKKEGINDYLRMQGFSYQMDSQLENTFLGYAFSGKEFPFMEIIQEAGPESILELDPIKGLKK